MNKRNLNKLKLSLTQIIKEWMDKQDDVPLPYIGKETIYYMATAAVVVLEAAEDLRESLEEDGELKTAKNAQIQA